MKAECKKEELEEDEGDCGMGGLFGDDDWEESKSVPPPMPAEKSMPVSTTTSISTAIAKPSTGNGSYDRFWNLVNAQSSQGYWETESLFLTYIQVPEGQSLQSQVQDLISKISSKVSNP
mmetsp:Transcript_26636/g.19970  ORF Transcript_26636/g.19970 Transcript_26636/m.19970 type:complete len:119 (-) Transcript_26636:199-555(-)|eukprot:CAMPEP_0202980282 /NCGR_PEP_ID=MMETSP1396-20130829/86235_1 /ASSEMBLY_ACC=CAM_ASM_000872 /TAXON_ID= /ORGANISM="Pseudokeronopsis sp., Strain Brazil" /LENGTH=118 /DNA_ID=CAMNT_0049720161 /DNA_START=1765 /DNA_END=2121 /DNA_ORIENTATION=-